MSFIGIDLGGTFIKGAILDIDAMQIRHSRRIPFPDFERGASYERVVSPEKILKSFHHLLDELLSIEPACDGLLLCGQMHSLVFCDSLGNPRSPIITWQDQRAQLLFEQTGKSSFDLLAGIMSNWDLRILGNELRVGLPLTQLFYLKQNNSLPDGLYPVSLMDFVLANLCKTIPVTDSTNAEAHGVYNIVEDDWEFHLIDKLGFNKLLWPEIKPHYSIVGTFTKNRKEIPCYLASGDQQYALLGSFLDKRELSLNIATGSQVSLISDSCELGNYQTRPFFDGKFIKTITHIPAGRALNSLIRLFTEISVSQMDSEAIWSYIQSQVEKASETDLDVSINFYSGPIGNGGHIANMREDNMTVGHVFSAAFKRMAENYYQCALKLSPEKEWDHVVFSGGLVSNIPALYTMIIKRLGANSFRINHSKEDVLMGLFIMAKKINNMDVSLAEVVHIVRAATNVVSE